MYSRITLGADANEIKCSGNFGLGWMLFPCSDLSIIGSTLWKKLPEKPVKDAEPGRGKTSGGVRRCRVALSRQMKAEEILERSSIHEMQIKSRHTRQKNGLGGPALTEVKAQKSNSRKPKSHRNRRRC